MLGLVAFNFQTFITAWATLTIVSGELVHMQSHVDAKGISVMLFNEKYCNIVNSFIISSRQKYERKDFPLLLL